MRRFAFLAFVALGLYVLQSSILSRLSFHGAGPDLLLLFTVSFAFLRGARFGVFAGFFAGLLTDLASGGFFGVNVFLLMLVGFACGEFSDQVFKDQLVLPIVAALVATVGKYFLGALLVLLMGYRFQMASHAEHMLLPLLFWQCLCVYPVYRLTAWSVDRVWENG